MTTVAQGSVEAQFAQALHDLGTRLQAIDARTMADRTAAADQTTRLVTLEASLSECFSQVAEKAKEHEGILAGLQGALDSTDSTVFKQA